jgi:hypothetical protein
MLKLRELFSQNFTTDLMKDFYSSLAVPAPFLRFVLLCGLVLRLGAASAQTGCGVSFAFTGELQSWPVPADVTSIRIEAAGASGGGNDRFSPGGLGAKVTGTFAVIPGEVLQIIVGGKGEDDPFSGGGGGGTFIARGGDGFSNFVSANILLIAGGGGGADFGRSGGSSFGFESTADGLGGMGTSDSGGGGSAEQNGGGGTLGGQAAINGAAGGAGDGPGGFGGGGASDSFGGGGGGGATGGNGGDVVPGAGGTSFNGGGNPVNTPAANAGNGFVIISYTGFVDTEPPTVSCDGTIAPVSVSANNCLAAVPDLLGAGNEVSVMDNCDPAPVLSQSPEAGFPVAPGTNTIIITARDAAGNVGSCNYVLTAVDNTPPTVSCPGTVNANVDAGQCTAVVNFSATATDNCAGSLTVSFSQNPGTSFPVGATTVTASASDGTSTGSCTFDVTVVDNELPLVTCQDITVELGPDGTFSILSSSFANDNIITSQSDNCDLRSSVIFGGGTLFNCGNIGIPNLRSIEKVDVNGNISVPCLFDVTVTDPLGVCNQPPDAVCQPVTVSADANCVNITTVAADFDGGSTDPDNDPLTFSVSPAGPYALGTTDVTLTVSDGVESTTCMTTITVEDNIAPMADCQNLTVYLDQTGNASITGNDLDDNSTDNCAIVTRSAAPANFTCSNVGSNQALLTVIDQSGNMNSCTSNVMVRDTVSPIALCQNTIVQLDQNGIATLDPAALDGGSTDNCTAPGDLTFTANITSFTCDQEGPLNAITVTLTVEDESGNSKSCTGQVEVDDKVLPVAGCRDFTAQLDDTGNVTVLPDDIENGSTDNCDFTNALSVTPNTFDCDDTGQDFTVTLHVGDGNGNQNTCEATVTVEDNEAPVLSCVDLEIELNADGTYQVGSNDFFQATGATDNCGIAFFNKTTGGNLLTCNNLGTASVTLFVTDVNGQTSRCTVNQIVTDPLNACNQPPTAICQDITVNANTNCQGTAVAADFDNGSSDPDGDPITFSVSPEGPYSLGNTMVTFTVSDGQLDATCTATITVEDNTAPAIIGAGCEISNASASAYDDGWDSGDSDISGLSPWGLSTSASGGAGFFVFSSTINGDGDDNGDDDIDSGTNRAWGLFSNNGGNAVATRNFLQTFSPGSSFSIQLDHGNREGTNSNNAFILFNGSGQILWELDAFGSSSNYSLKNGDGSNVPTDIPITDEGIQLDIVQIDATTVSATITPLNGGPSRTYVSGFLNGWSGPIAAMAVSNINGGDFSQNDFFCNNIQVCYAACEDITVNNDSGQCGAIVNLPGIALDNCDGELPLQYSPSSGPFFNVGITTVSASVMDAAGNSSSCNFNVFVNDAEPPMAICQNVTVQLDANGNGSTTALAVDNGSTDACGIDTYELSRTAFTCADVGANPVVLTVTDVNGNPATCDAVVTVEDNIAPVITLIEPMPRTIVLDDEGLFTLPVSALATAADACGVESLTAVRTGLDQSLEITEEGTILNFTCEDIGENTLLLTATDVNGNSSTAEATVIVDFEQPRFACISELNLTLDEFCVAELIPRMFLTGEVACLDEFPMKITVFDDNPDNGGIVDGCGRFQFKVESTGTGALDLDFATCWGYVNAEDKTAPNEVATPEDVELPCVDFEEIMLTMLPSDINRCWEVERVEEDNDDTSNGLYTISQPGFVLVEGTMAPALKDRLDLIAGDVSSSDPNFSAGPAIVAEFSDGCAPRLQICVNDVATFGEDPGCDDIVITRTFTATELDNCENAAGEENGAATASFEITFKRPSIDDFVDEGVTELEVAHYECDEALDADANGNPIPRASDVPVWDFNGTGREIPLLVNADLCNIALTYEDGPRINTCPNTYKFVRTYTIIDWCKPVEVKTLTQVVKVGDTTAPHFEGPVQDIDFDGVIDGDGTAERPLNFTTNAGDACAAYIRLDDPTIKLTDNCSAGIELKADIYPNKDTNGAPIGTFYLDLTDGDAEVAGPIPAGEHIVRYTYTDDCGNSSFTDLHFEVVDRTAPVAICEDGLNVSLTSGGTTAGPSTGVVVLTPDMVDKNSYDDCSDVTLKIGRVMQLANGTYELLPDTDYEHELLLDCSDLGTVLVGLEVTDEAGNVNYCWLEVLVEDKARPICFAPAPVTISCIEYNAELPADLSEATNDELDAAFGPATAVDNCGATVAQTITGDVNSCGVGQFTRTFTVTDAQGLTNAADCEQVIRVYGVHDYTLIFPTDAEADCMEDPVYDGVEFEERACDLITINTIIDTFPTQTTAADECFKLEITYDVINWCEYNSIGQAYLIPRDKEDGRRDVEQDELYLHVRPGEDSFDNLSDDDAWLSLFNEDGSAGPTYDPGFPQYDIELDNGDDLDGDDDDNGDDNIDEFEYAEDDSRGFFRYVQFVKIYDEEEPVVMVNEPTDCFAGIGDECVAEVTLSFTAMDDCSDVSVSVELDAEYKGTPTEFERTRFLTSSEVVDNGDGSYTVRLTDVPVGDHALRVRAGDGCGNFDVDILEFCVSADKAPTPICIQTMTVTLMPDGNGGGMAAIWATDFINSDVEDCFGNVIDKYSIYTEEEANESGFLPVVGRDGIELTCEDFGGDDVNVRVYAIDNNSNADYCAVVLEVQAFQEGLCEGSSGSLSGLIMTQDAELMAGVEVSLTGDNAVNETVTTAADGQYRFTNLAIESDYTVNPDYRASFDFGAVTVTDIVSITNHILGTNVLTTGYDHVAADVNLDADVNIFDLVAMRRVILGLQDELNDAGATWRFVEAGYNLTPGNWMATFPEVYNVNNLQGNVTDADFVVVELGNVVRSGGRAALELKVEDAELAAGQTHTIELNSADLAGFQGTLELAAGLELVNVSYEGEGALNLNRAGEGLIALAFNGAAVINLAVRATEALRLSETVSLTDAITLREGVAANGTAGALRLTFGNLAPASAHNALEQNMPNPVAETTRIGYTLATAGQVTLTVQDIQGRTVLVRELEGVAGRNVIELNVNELGGAAGVLSYTVTSGDFTATKKMVVVR